MTEETKDTPMAGLMAIRDKIAAKQVLNLRIPRWDDPQILVSYRPLTQRAYGDSMNKLLDPDLKDAESRAQASRDANTDLIIKACTGIELRGSEINGKFGGFDNELAQNLGLAIPTARQTCQTLFIADGDLVRHVNKLMQWSGFANTQIEDDFSGE